MDVNYLIENFESLCNEVHKAWMNEMTKQGFHAPADCALYGHSDDKRVSQGKFTRHCGKCHTDLYDYGDLPENVKEYDRVTVNAVIQAIEKL